MFTRLEALNYRSLRYVSQPMSGFHLLVGPNGSGKSTFLDVIQFVADALNKGIEAAIQERSDNFVDLVFGHDEKAKIELAIESEIPAGLRELAKAKSFDRIRYVLRLEQDLSRNPIVGMEKVEIWKKDKEYSHDYAYRNRNPEYKVPASFEDIDATANTIVSRNHSGNSNYVRTHLKPADGSSKRKGSNWRYSFRTTPRELAFAQMIDDETLYPQAIRFRQMLKKGILSLQLDGRLRELSPPRQSLELTTHCENLPWVIDKLSKDNPDALDRWVSHLRTAIPEIKAVRSKLVPDTQHRYVEITYKDGTKVPSWMVSEGTMRLLALTLPAYIPGFDKVLMVENPEYGLHPQAIETAYNSLRSVYGGQVLAVTHSPVLLACAESSELLCFSKTSDCKTKVVSGSVHPQLKNWKRDISLGDLFAAGVLG